VVETVLVGAAVAVDIAPFLVAAALVAVLVY
jgi:hypothetical protein